MGRPEGAYQELILGLFETEGFFPVWGLLLLQNMRVLGDLRGGCLSYWDLWVLICSHPVGTEAGGRCDRSIGDSGFLQFRAPCQECLRHSLEISPQEEVQPLRTQAQALEVARSVSQAASSLAQSRSLASRISYLTVPSILTFAQTCCGWR